MKYTFFYVVGGDEKYYEFLFRSIRSLSRLKESFKIKILDTGNKIESKGNIEVVNIKYPITSSRVFWQHKYFLTQQIDTEYGIYLDTDTVVCNDRLNELCLKINNSIGVIKHFWIQDFSRFYKCFPNLQFSNFTKIYELNENHNFYTGGVFLFKNSQRSINAMRDVYEFDKFFYEKFNKENNGFYDEIFLSTILKFYPHVCLNGSVNHCCANHMPLIFENNKLKGKNPFEKEFEDIFVLHGSSKRQFLGEDFSGQVKEKIIEFWNI